MRGIKVEILGEEHYFVPTECGAKGDGKRKAVDALQHHIEVHEKDPFPAEVQKQMAILVMDLARTLLEQNYQAEELEEKVENMPVGAAGMLLSLAQFGRVPENFMIG